LRVQLCEMAPEGGAEAHAHDDEDQILLVVEGRLVLRGGEDEELRVGSGEGAVIPAGTEHATEADAAGLTSYLVLTFPAEE
jgi:quercetin dioxygenase-like cupin family protein